jgi:ketosteroid isomerase-like protein
MTTNTERLRAFVGLMNSGQFDEGRKMISERIVIQEPAAIPYGGEFRGLAGFDEFRRIFGATWKSWSDGPMWYAENDGMVVKLNVITAVSRATGRTYVTPLAEFFTFEDGQITGIKIFYQDITGFLAAVEPADAVPGA